MMFNATMNTLLALPLGPTLTVAGTAAGLVSIPIIIHLLNRQRFRVVAWAAMDFLLKAMRKNRKRLRFEQMLLLVTRCTLISLFYFAFAWILLMSILEGLGCSKTTFANVGSRSGLNVLVIDNSYSTRYEANRAGAKTHLDQEKVIAKRIIDGLQGGGEGVVIITTSEPAARVLAKPSYDLNAAKAAIDRIEPGFGRTDLAGALQHAVQVAQEAQEGLGKRLYILSDGTKSAWEGRQAEGLKHLGPELAKHYGKNVTHFNMSEGRQQQNAAALSLRPGGNLVTTKFDVELVTDAKGYGALGETQLRWTLDGKPLGDAKVLKLHPTAEPVIVQVKSALIKSGGPRVAVASLGGDQGADPLRVDDKQYRVMDVASELKVLIVEGTRGQTALEGSGAFLQLALSPPADPSTGMKTSSYVTSELISDIELRGKPLGEYRAVVLAGVGSITEQEADGLRAFVERGGTLMVFMGEPVSKDNYNSVLLPRKLLPGPLVSLVDAGTAGRGWVFDFEPNKQQHRFLKMFERHENTGLNVAKTFTYWQLEVPKDSAVERVLNYRVAPATPAATDAATPTTPADATVAAPAGPLDPAITNHPLGQGNVVFVATTASPRWTSLPARPAYLELMHEMLSNGVRPGDYWMNLTVGQFLEIPHFVKLGGAPKLKDDANTDVVIEAVTDRDPKTGQPLSPVYRSVPLMRPGVYSLDLGNGTVPIAVNLPADEADVRPVGNESIQKALGGISMSLLNDQMPDQAALYGESNDMSGWLLTAVLVLLGAECFMAMAFGHYRRSEAARA